MRDQAVSEREEERRAGWERECWAAREGGRWESAGPEKGRMGWVAVPRGLG